MRSSTSGKGRRVTALAQSPAAAPPRDPVRQSPLYWRLLRQHTDGKRWSGGAVPPADGGSGASCAGRALLVVEAMPALVRNLMDGVSTPTSKLAAHAERRGGTRLSPSQLPRRCMAHCGCVRTVWSKHVPVGWRHGNAAAVKDTVPWAAHMPQPLRLCGAESAPPQASLFRSTNHKSGHETHRHENIAHHSPSQIFIGARPHIFTQ